MTVSFIVPMYNAAPYIERCARSLFAQTFESCEFIFVDDCSVDGSVTALMNLVTYEFSHLKSRVTLVRHASNLGVSETRNTALTVAKGKFVIFVDADDCVDCDLAEEMVIEQLVEDSDIIFSDYYSVSNGEKRLCKGSVIGGRDGMLNILASQSFAVENRIWGILIRRSLIVNNGLKFTPRLTIGEDLFFLTQLLYYAKRVSSMSQPLYHYHRDNEHSAMGDLTLRKRSSYVRAVGMVDSFLMERGDCVGYGVTRYLQRRNLRKWLILRSGGGAKPLALVFRMYMFVLNMAWRMKWAYS